MTTREQRRAILRDQIDGTDTDVEQVDAVDPAPVAPVSLTFEQLKELLSLASGKDDIGGAIANALRDNRQPIPENTDAQYHGRSSFHPGGKDVPRPVLRADTYLAVWDSEHGKAIPWAQYEAPLLHDDEIVALNSLQPCVGTIMRLDGSPVGVRVVFQEDGSGGLHRVLVAFPKGTFDKDVRNMLPGAVSIASQLTASLATA
jgi:hypothetical protein